MRRVLGPDETTEYAQGFMAGIVVAMFLGIAAYLCVVAADAYQFYKDCALRVEQKK